MTTICYIPVPISEAPKEDKAYLMMYPDGIFSNRMIFFSNGDWELNPEIRGYTHYLKPVDLSKMLEETFKRGWYDRGYERKTLKVYMDDHINSVLNPPKMTEEQLTKDWQEYSGYYCKAMQDIKLKNGDEIMMCWPNAGVWNVCSDGPYKNQEIKNSDVTHVRKTHDKNW